MGSVSEARYCARGERCVAYKDLGQPTKLSRYVEDGICSPCREAERDAQAELSATEDSTQQASLSRPEQEVVECKLSLVAQLALGRGEFWRLIRDVRARWDITPERRSPPEGEPGTLYPKVRQESDDQLYLWVRDLEDVKGKVVHPRYFPRTNWRAFLSLCVLYDPPVHNGLLAFANYGETRHESLRWQNPYDLLAVERAIHEEIVRALLERFRLVGLDAEKEYVEALRTIRERPGERRAEIRSYDVAELVDERVRRGRRRAIENLSIELECLILHERYGWTYEQIDEYHRAKYPHRWPESSPISHYLKRAREFLDS